MKTTVSSGMDLVRARLRACDTHWPALRRALMALTIVRSDDIPTAAVDEWWRVYYNADFFGRLTAEAAAAVAVHEVWHLLRFHTWRARALAVPAAHAYLWNLVGDAEIHAGDPGCLAGILAGGEVCTPVTRQSFEPELPDRGTSETWYRELLSRSTTKPPSPETGGQAVPLLRDKAGRTGYPADPGFAPVDAWVEGSGVHGRRMPWEEAGPADGGPPGIARERVNSLQRQVAREILEASKSRGEGAAGMLRWAEEVITHKVDWRQRVRHAAQRIMQPVFGRVHWSYRRPSRRQPADLRLVPPGWQGAVPSAAVLIDTSGSMSDPMMCLCLGETTSFINSLCRGSARPFVRVYTCDGAASEAQTVHRGAEVKLIGGGGTDMRVGLRAILEDSKKSEHPYDIVVVMTDGYTPWPDGAFPIPLVVMLTGECATPSWLRRPPHEVVLAEPDPGTPPGP